MRPQPSFFNRLLDARATASRYDVADYQQAIVRDLINLLNTICWAEQDWKLSQRSPLVRGSILGYGVPPIPEETTRDARTKVLAQTIERVIGQHEPRLRDVTVASSLSPAGAADSRLYFTISATLVVDVAQSTPIERDFFAGLFMIWSGDRFSAAGATKQ